MAAEEQIVPTPCQQQALRLFERFVGDGRARVFVLTGYAGTGKTTLVKRLIAEMEQRELNYRLLASTGRAAKILSNITGRSAGTVHGLIYRFADFNQDLEKIVSNREKNLVDDTGQLLLDFECCENENSEGKTCYYIVDEASMIADCEDKLNCQARFGSGRLLRDLLAYDPAGKFVFVGDSCQLPPVSQESSPALMPRYIEQTYGKVVMSADLNEVVRQAQGNDIAVSAKRVRELCAHPQPWKWAKFPLRDYRNVHLLGSQTELLRRYIADVEANGYNNATMIAYSNRQCSGTTSIIRPAVGISEHQVTKGDLLLVTQNNYISGLMNGDMVQVVDVGERQLRAGLEFAYVTVKELFTQRTVSQLMITNIVYSGQTNLSATQQRELSIDYFLRMRDMGLSQGDEGFKRNMMTDQYFNALRCVFGYMLTCHKSQGGEWNNVYLDIPRSLAAERKPYVYQWLYTAMTRAKQNLYVVDDFYIKGYNR